jgi:hypothetical protein
MKRKDDDGKGKEKKEKEEEMEDEKPGIHGVVKYTQPKRP